MTALSVLGSVQLRRKLSKYRTKPVEGNRNVIRSSFFDHMGDVKIHVLQFTIETKNISDDTQEMPIMMHSPKTTKQKGR